MISAHDRNTVSQAFSALLRGISSPAPQQVAQQVIAPFIAMLDDNHSDTISGTRAAVLTELGRYAATRVELALVSRAFSALARLSATHLPTCQTQADTLKTEQVVVFSCLFAQSALPLTPQGLHEVSTAQTLCHTVNDVANQMTTHESLFVLGLTRLHTERRLATPSKKNMHKISGKIWTPPHGPVPTAYQELTSEAAAFLTKMELQRFRI